MCEHRTMTATCADCAPAPAAGHFGFLTCGEALLKGAPDGCPTLDEFESRYANLVAPILAQAEPVQA